LIEFFLIPPNSQLGRSAVTAPKADAKKINKKETTELAAAA
jgi:hypothetical protein